MGVNLASFKNSRQYPRQATTQGTTSDITVLADTTPDPLVTPLLPVSENRTYATVYNRHATDSFKFVYRKSGDPIPLVASILATGFEVIAGAAYEIDSPQEVWAISTTGNAIPVDLDVGTG